MGLFSDLIAAIRRWGPDPAEPIGRDDSPADGVVEVAVVANAVGEPNASEPRFRRFTALEPITSPPRRRRPSRSMPPLLGRVAFASLYLGRNGKAWNDDEIARSQKALIRAGEWIEREAMRRGARVNIEIADLYFLAEDPARDDIVEIAVSLEEYREGLDQADARTKLVSSASRAAAALGFRDVADLAASVAARLKADAVVWLIHPRSTGRSFGVPEADTGLRGVSLAICYAREDNFPGPLIGSPFADPTTVAHEVLHLFGASDKYDVPLSSFPGDSVSRADIMRLDESKLSRLRIDPMTAEEIGWG